MPYDSLLFLSTLNVYTKEGQMQVRNSLTAFVVKPSAQTICSRIDVTPMSSQSHPNWYPGTGSYSDKHYSDKHYSDSSYSDMPLSMTEFYAYVK